MSASVFIEHSDDQYQYTSLGGGLNNALDRSLLVVRVQNFDNVNYLRQMVR